MKFQYYDIHGHVHFDDYDADREAVIERAAAAGVGMINVGTHLATSTAAIALAEKHDNMWATVGMHPVPKQAFDYEAFKKLALHPKVVAIGECGLDLFHAAPEELPAQLAIFERQIDLANEVGKPLMLHVRNGNAKNGLNTNDPRNAYMDAYIEAIALLKRRAKVRANFHFFAGSVEDMKAAIEAGCSISLTGVITFARNYDEVVRQVPLDRIMSETDCPYVSPAPHRGKRNEPSYVLEVIKKIAEIRGMDETACAAALAENARAFFGIN